MSDTIFYKLKLKRTKTPAEVFEKMQRSVKKKGPTKNWACTVDEKNECMIIDFGDGESESFALSFENKLADGFCKVAFPLEGELFDDEKKSEFKALLNMIYSARTFFSQMEITDDYDIAEEYLNSLKNKMVFRELKDAEKKRLDRLYKLGFTNYDDLLLAIFAEDLGLPEDFEWKDILNPDIRLNDGSYPFIVSVCENYIFETSLLGKKTLKEIYETKYWWTGMPCAEVYPFSLGVGILFPSYFPFHINSWGMGVQVSKFFIEKFLPVFNTANAYERCELAYRLMVSIYDFCKFKYVGKSVVEPVPRTKFNSGYKYLSAYLPNWK